MKKRKPIRRISKGRSQRLAEYERLKTAHFMRNPQCKRCGIVPKHPVLHHPHGRVYGLLNEHRLFITLCEACHYWVHVNISEARKLKLIAPLGQWNSNPFKK